MASDEPGTAQHLFDAVTIPQRVVGPLVPDMTVRPWLRTRVVAEDRVRTTLTVATGDT